MTTPSYTYVIVEEDVCAVAGREVASAKPAQNGDRPQLPEREKAACLAQATSLGDPAAPLSWLPATLSGLEFHFACLDAALIFKEGQAPSIASLQVLSSAFYTVDGP